MSETTVSEEQVERLEQFAMNILCAQKAGAWPLKDVDRLVVVLAQMVISLAGSNKVLREQCEVFRGCAETLAWLNNPVHNPNLM